MPENKTTTYGKTNLVEDVMRRANLGRTDATAAVNAVLDIIQENIVAGQRVTLTGFGTFQQSHYQARKGVNIRTKQPITIPARTSVRWTPGSLFKSALSGADASGGTTGGYASERRASAGGTPTRGRKVPTR